MPNSLKKLRLEKEKKNTLIAALIILGIGLGAVITGTILEFVGPLWDGLSIYFIIIPGSIVVFIAIVIFLIARSLKVKIDNL
ncbi:MAG: hypothetical protein ACTSQX_16465 [Candidatus Heimdallarchaeota archaeon]